MVNVVMASTTTPPGVDDPVVVIRTGVVERLMVVDIAALPVLV